MAGVPQQSNDSMAGLPRAMAAPPWMQVAPSNPANPSISGYPSAGISATSIPMQTRPPAIGSTGTPPPYASPQVLVSPMQFRPPGPLPPQTVQQQFVSVNPQHFRPGIVPIPSMGTQIGLAQPNMQVLAGPANSSSLQPTQFHYNQTPPPPSQQLQRLTASQGLSMLCNQQQRPPMTSMQHQLQQPSQLVNIPSAINAGAPPPTFQFSSTAAYPQPQSTYGVAQAVPLTSGLFQSPAQVQQVQNVKPATQPWQMVSVQTNASVSHQGVQTGQAGSLGATFSSVLQSYKGLQTGGSGLIGVSSASGLTTHQGGQTGQSGSIGVTSALGVMTSGLISSISGDYSSTLGLSSNAPGPSDWQEHIAPGGRRYYYNKRTKQSNWEKPLELMTLTERADASTVWKEFTTGDGKKYYYNKVTKLSTWTMPEEMKVAREKVEKGTGCIPTITTSEGAPAAKLSPVNVEKPSPDVSSAIQSPGCSISVIAAAPVVVPLTSQATASITHLSEDPAISPANNSAVPVVSVVVPVTSQISTSTTHLSVAPVVSAADNSAIDDEIHSSATTDIINDSQKTAIDLKETPEVESSQDIEEARKAVLSAGNANSSPTHEDKSPAVVEEPLTFASKLEAKNAFKDLLEAAHIESDWTWEQAMRLIINDKRYGALKSLGERKQTFNEYLAQKKKEAAEEKRLKQKKAREDFVVMLQDSKELTSTMRWSKAAILFSDDPRFQAIERDRDRETLFEDYLVDLERKERERAREERKKNLIEYRAFLETCNFIKVDTPWRKVQDRLEDDERCSRLEKIDRLEIFQEYVRDLEKQEEEEKKAQKEELRRRERKSREDFRNLLEEHRASGTLTARVGWRDYILKVQGHPAYIAVSANVSGPTAKELFEDVVEELEKQYNDDKSRVKDAMKIRKIMVTSTWFFDQFKIAMTEGSDLGVIDEQNLKLIFDELRARAQEKEEKEAKERRRTLENFNEILHSEKAISSSSKWEDIKVLIENIPEYRALNDEIIAKKSFDDYVIHLQLKAKEKDQRREAKVKKVKEKEKDREKRKDKERKGKERDKEKSKKKETKDYSEIIGDVSNHLQCEEHRKDKVKDKNRDKEKDKRHKKRHRNSSGDMYSEKEEKREEKRSHRHSNDKRRSSRKHGHASGLDNDDQHKRHRKGHDRWHKNGAAEEAEDGEFGEEGDI